MEAYAAAKAKLFEYASLKTAVLNRDDPVGVRLARRMAAQSRCHAGAVLMGPKSRLCESP
jgi:UDP-N-acetylmuramoyl-L-alanyl-D-glutamate--2,6-diaminopimelate ligase